MKTRPAREHAIVLGGGIAGLLAARVLADAYRAVTVLDRDDLTAVSRTAAAPRRGVPQGRHIHALLARAVTVLDELLPGLTDALVADGAPRGDALGDARLRLSGHTLVRTSSGLPLLSVSRGLLERHVRERVRGHSGVLFAPPCDVVGLTAIADGGRVTGVRRIRRAPGSAEEVVPADLVVDASGRVSRTPDWLAALGRRRALEERVGVDLGYATRRYRARPGALDGDLGRVVAPVPAAPRGGAVARIEGGQLLLTLMGMAGDHPPVDPHGFDAFARSVWGLGSVVADADALDDPVPFRFPAAVRRRYDRADLPDGLVVVGDAVCSLNPIYGQGMTVAAVEALALRDHLRRHPVPHPQRYQRSVGRIVAGPWEMSTGADLAFDGVEGRPSPKARAVDAYVSRLHAAAALDPAVARAFARVAGLVDRPEALLRPAIAVRVLRRRPSPAAGTSDDGRRDPGAGAAVGEGVR